MNSPCLICGKTPTDRCHIKSKGAGGTWAMDNILLMCRDHHQQQHSLGWSRFTKRYPQVLFELQIRGWSVVKGRLCRT